MVSRSTFRVGAADESFADVYVREMTFNPVKVNLAIATVRSGKFYLTFAFGNTVDVGTFRSRRTIGVFVALDRSSAAIVVRISDGSGRTVTFVGSVRIEASRRRSTGEVCAEIDEFAALSRVSGITRLAVANLLVLFGRAK